VQVVVSALGPVLGWPSHGTVVSKRPARQLVVSQARSVRAARAGAEAGAERMPGATSAASATRSQQVVVGVGRT